METKKPRIVKRGEIYSCRLPKAEGSVQKRNRPVIVLQNNLGNRFSPTVIVAVLSSKRFNSNYPMHVDVAKEITKLKQDSTILLEQIMTVDKSQLGPKITSLIDNPEIIEQINHAIELSLGLK